MTESARVRQWVHSFHPSNLIQHASPCQKREKPLFHLDPVPFLSPSPPFLPPKYFCLPLSDFPSQFLDKPINLLRRNALLPKVGH